MKIVLITPPPLKSLIYGDMKFSKVDSVVPPLGLLSLAAYIRKHGHSAVILDGYAYNYNIDKIVNEIKNANCDVVGITATTPLINSAIDVANRIKNDLDIKKIIIGGPHLTALPEETIKNDCFSVGIIGEGEITLRELLDAYEQGRDIADILGIIFKKGQIITRNEERTKIENLDELPFPAWDLLPSILKPYRASIIGTTGMRSTPIVTSRGCPAQCIFCDTTTFGRRYRFFSADYVLSMIEHLFILYNINDFLIYDDTFCANRQRLKAICNGIIEKGLSISWQCCARVEQVNEELLALMRRAGCWQIEYGIESGDPKILEIMKKGIDLDKARKIIELTDRNGIQARGNFIFGNLMETKESLQRTINFALSTELTYVQQTFLTPYPGSEIFSVADKYGTFSSDYNKMSNMTINFIPSGLTEKDLKYYSSLFFRKFYLRPKIIIKFIKSIKSFESLKRLVISFIVFLGYIVDGRLSDK